MKENSVKKYLILEFTIIAFMLICLIPIMAKPNIWFDESFTVGLVRKPVPEIIYITSLDVHPPLYYLITKLFITVFGDSIFVFHLPPLLFYLGLIAISALFFNRYFNPQLSLLVTAALCSAPNMIKYALQLRSYSLSMLLVTGSFYMTYIIMQKYSQVTMWKFKALWKYWVGLALINVAAAYTHSFSGLAAVCISFFLLAYMLYKEKHIRVLLPWLIYCLIMFVLYLPWLPTFINQVKSINGNYWIGDINEAALHGYSNMLFLMSSDNLRKLLIVVFLAGCFLMVRYLSKNTQYCWVIGCFAVFLFWLSFGVGYSLVRTPILTDRYLVIFLPLLWVPPLYGIAISKKEYVIAGAIFVFILCFIDNYEEHYSAYATSYNIPLLSTIEEYAKEDDIFFHFYYEDLFIYEAYFPEYDHYILKHTLENRAKYYIALTSAYTIKDLKDLPDTSASIWCSNGDWISSFEQLGYEIEPFDLGSSRIYRMHKH